MAELKKIWQPEAQGKIMNWNQVRAGFPDRPLRLYGPGVNSGTYDYFTAAIVGKEHSSRGDFTASEDDNVLVQGISGDINALGFFGLAYYHENENKLKGVAIKLERKVEGRPAHVRDRDGWLIPATDRVPIFIYVSKKVLEDEAIGGGIRRVLSQQGERREARQGSRLRAAAARMPMTCSCSASRSAGPARRSPARKIGVSVDDLLKAPLVN